MEINDEKIGVHDLSESTFENNVTIILTAYEVHQLLKVFDNQLCICNRDQTNTIDIYEKICSQAHGKDFIYYGSKKHKRLEPEYFKKLEEEELKRINENIKKNMEAYRNEGVSWWKKLFGKA